MNRDMISEAIDKLETEYIDEAGHYGVSRERQRDGRILYLIAAMCAALVLVVVSVPLASKLASVIGAGSFGAKSREIVIYNVSGSCGISPSLDYAGEEYVPWRRAEHWTAQDPDAPREYTVSFGGYEYTGTYVESGNYNSPADMRTIHEYEFVGGKFRIAEGGGLCRIEFYYTMPKSDGGETSEDECEKTARAAAGEFIDPEKYTVTRIIMHTESEFIYDRQVGNVSTALVDSVRVRLWEDGRIRSVEIITPGTADKMKEDEILRLGDSDEAISKIEDKLGSIFGSYDRYDIQTRHALILPDGSTGVIYVLYVYRGENIDGLFLLAAFGNENTDADTGTDTVDDRETEKKGDTGNVLDSVYPDNRVSDAAVDSITIGMTAEEVTDRLGYPNEVKRGDDGGAEALRLRYAIEEEGFADIALRKDDGGAYVVLRILKTMYAEPDFYLPGDAPTAEGIAAISLEDIENVKNAVDVEEIVFRLMNISDKTLTVDPGFVIKRVDNDEWTAADTGFYVPIDEDVKIEPGTTWKLRLPVRELYGALRPGEYCIIIGCGVPGEAGEVLCWFNIAPIGYAESAETT